MINLFARTQTQDNKNVVQSAVDDELEAAATELLAHSSDESTAVVADADADVENGGGRRRWGGWRAPAPRWQAPRWQAPRWQPRRWSAGRSWQPRRWGGRVR